MNSPALIYALRWLIRDTFRQAVAGKVFWILLILSAMAIVFCLGVSVEGGLRFEEGELVTPSGEPHTASGQPPGKLHLLFGAMKIDFYRGPAQEVHLIQVVLATWVAGTVGLLLTLVWTAGFLPDSLQPASASVLLAKPVPRWVFLLGKYLGVVLFMALQTFIFFFGTWVALGLKTDVWEVGYLAGIPLLTLQFAGLFAFSVLLAVLTRNTVACVLGVVLFWAICTGVNYARHAAMALPELSNGAEMSGGSLFLINLGYWVLPKPADMLILLEDALGAASMKTTLSSLPEFAAVQRLGAFDPLLSMASIFLFVALMLALAGYQLRKVDY